MYYLKSLGFSALAFLTIAFTIKSALKDSDAIKERKKLLAKKKKEAKVRKKKGLAPLENDEELEKF